MITRDLAAFFAHARGLAPDAGPACAKAAFLVTPEGFALAEQSASDNAYMDLGVAVDPARALAQHRNLQRELATVGGEIAAFYHCPFHKDAAVEAYRHDDHPDRKPNPGMILRGLAEAGLSPQECVLVGDNDSDVEAARRAGMPGFLFKGGDLLAFLRERLGPRFPAA